MIVLLLLHMTTYCSLVVCHYKQLASELLSGAVLECRQSKRGITATVKIPA